MGGYTIGEDITGNEELLNDFMNKEEFELK